MNKPHTEETKEKIRKAHLGKKLSESHRLKVIKTLRQEKGEANPNWKGGRTMKSGYVVIYLPSHPNAYPNGYVAEHRLVMERHLGRLLRREEVVHHINGDKEDNRVENLVVLTQKTHGEEHWKDDSKRKERSVSMRTIREKNPWSTKKLK